MLCYTVLVILLPIQVLYAVDSFFCTEIQLFRMNCIHFMSGIEQLLTD